LGKGALRHQRVEHYKNNLGDIFSVATLQAAEFFRRIVGRSLGGGLVCAKASHAGARTCDAFAPGLALDIRSAGSAASQPDAVTEKRRITGGE